MNINIRNYNEKKYLPKFQEGGEMAAPEQAAPAEQAPAAPEAGGDPTEQILMACQEVVQTQNCEMAIQVCATLLEMAGGSAQQAPAAPEGQAPVYKKGGKFVGWTKK